jgi:rhodanese-related sulfurtransferase
MSKDAFIQLITADQPDLPPYFAYDTLLNRCERQTLDQVLERECTPLSLDEVVRLMRCGAQVVDVRDPSDFAQAHLCGSLNIGLCGSYATWAGTLLDHDTPIVLIADPGRETEATMRLGRIGFDHVAGYLDDDRRALASHPALVRRTARITAATLAAQLAVLSEPPVLLDVRTLHEWQAGRIAGSLHIPLQHLARRLHEVPHNRQVVVYCASGYRSAIAVGLLEQHGHSRLADLVDGFTAWEATQRERNLWLQSTRHSISYLALS